MPLRSLSAARVAGAAVLAVLAAALAPAARAVAAPSLSVELAPVATVGPAPVLLGDVATLDGADAAAVERLRRLPLGGAPAAGAAVTLSRRDIERWIRAHTGLAAGQIAWGGNETTEVRGAVGEATVAARWRPLARQALLAWLARWSDHPGVADAEPEGADGADAPALPPGPLEARVRPLPEGQSPAPRMQVWIELWRAGRFVRALPLRFAVTAPAPALLARRPLAAGSRPLAADFEVGQVDLAALGHRLPAAGQADPWAALADGVRLRRALPAGAALDAFNSEPAPPVCNGDLVRLSLTAGPVALARPARALQDGLLGQRVAVRPPGATHSIMARVTGAGTVEVE